MLAFVEGGREVDANDVYQLRAEELERSFYSLRGVEWKVVFQVFAGYALIAAGWCKTKTSFSSLTALPFGLAGLCILLWVGSALYSWMLLQRLRWTRNLQNEYLKKLHETCSASRLNANPQPRFRVWYAFTIQQLLSFVIMLSIVFFIMGTR